LGTRRKRGKRILAGALKPHEPLAVDRPRLSYHKGGRKRHRRGARMQRRLIKRSRRARRTGGKRVRVTDGRFCLIQV